MSKVAVVYWSGTGNTEQMAEKVAVGAKDAGAEVSVFTATEFSADQLEESEFEPMFRECEAKLAGKKIALFGSYGWGDGEWMRNWEEQCLADGAVLACEFAICNEAPDAEAEIACMELGKSLAE